MVMLVHLNGPSGAGKSTLAQRYVDDHAGVLNLEIDTLVTLIGGWRGNFRGTVPIARDSALALAETHLRSGRDVVMPQLVASALEAQRFERAARCAEATYIEVALMLAPPEQIGRFRLKAQRSEVAAEIERVVDAEGGDAALERAHRHVTEYLAHRPAALRLDVTGDVDSTYLALLRVLSRS